MRAGMRACAHQSIRHRADTPKKDILVTETKGRQGAVASVVSRRLSYAHSLLNAATHKLHGGQSGHIEEAGKGVGGGGSGSELLHIRLDLDLRFLYGAAQC